MVQIIPAIIPESLEEIKEKVGLVSNLVDKVQIDFVDGKYAQTKTWPFNLAEHPGPAGMQLPNKDGLVLEADLMIKDPEDWIADFQSIGVRSFVIHFESTKYIDKCIFLARELGCGVGLAIKPGTDSGVLEEFVDKVDFIQFMGNDRVGYNGVELDRKVLKKIHDFRAKHPFLPIQIDIGVNARTAPELVQAGATALVSGSTVFKEGDIAENINKLKNNK